MAMAAAAAAKKLLGKFSSARLFPTYANWSTTDTLWVLFGLYSLDQAIYHRRNAKMLAIETEIMQQYIKEQEEKGIVSEIDRRLEEALKDFK